MTDTALAYLPSYRILNPGDFYNEGEGLHGTKKKQENIVKNKREWKGGLNRKRHYQRCRFIVARSG